MAKIFITGAADGLGQLAAKELISMGHHVVMHARNAERADQAIGQAPGAASVLIADLSNFEEVKSLAQSANKLGTFDAVIHNAGVYQVSGRSPGAENLPVLFAVNSLAPYMLTSLMNKPQRIIYLSSGMHLQGSADMQQLAGSVHNKDGRITYSDTKLHVLLLSMAMARMNKSIHSNAVDPGWVPTKMGGAGAPDDLDKGFETQVWLSVSNDPEALVSGKYFHHKKQQRFHTAADNENVQDQFLALCADITGVQL